MTECECRLAGYCTRHRAYKNQAAVDLCRTNRDIFLMNEVKANNIKEPGIIKKGKNLITAISSHIVEGAGTASEEEQNMRLTICNNCPLFNKFYETCRLCGCSVAAKVKLPSSSCPDNPPRW